MEETTKTGLEATNSAPAAEVKTPISHPIVEKKTTHEEKPNQGPLAAEDWVAVAFALFVILFFFKVLPKINTMLDSRTAKIASELKQASALRAEAEKLLASAKKKSSDAETAAIEMIATAKAEAKRIATKAETDMNEEAARKMVIVKKKIKRAEQQAVETVKKEAVEEASKIATNILSLSAAKNHKSLLTESIAKITSSIN